MNKYLEKIASFTDVASKYGRRAKRLGSGAFGVVGDFSNTFAGKGVEETVKDSTKVLVRNPFTRKVKALPLTNLELQRLNNLSDSEKIKHIASIYGSNSKQVQKLKGEINKRDAARVAVGGTAAVVLASHLKKRFSDNYGYYG